MGEITIYDNPRSHYIGGANGYLDTMTGYALCPRHAMAEGWLVDDMHKSPEHDLLYGDVIPGMREWIEPLTLLSGEADSPTHCDQCRALLWHPLTKEGYEYVRESIKSSDGDPEVLAAWKEAYLG